MKVVEKFISINGESSRAGELSVFVRFKGCNLKCSYCDTMWANQPDCEYDELSPNQIAEYIENAGVSNVTLTGGEPLLQPEIHELLKILAKNDKIRVEIETNGSVYLKPFCDEYRPFFTMDYKLPASGCEADMNTENFDLLSRDDVVKFVCGCENDVLRTFDIINKYNLSEKCGIYLSPVFGDIEPANIVELMIKHKMNNIRLQIQMHKVIWQPDQKGV